MVSGIVILRPANRGAVVAQNTPSGVIINVYIAYSDIYPGGTTYRSLYVPFINELGGVNVVNISGSEVPDRIINLFRDICRQTNEGRRLDSITDENNQVIRRQQTDPLDRFNAAASSVFGAIATGQQDRNVWQSLVSNLGASLIGMSAASTMQLPGRQGVAGQGVAGQGVTGQGVAGQPSHPQSSQQSSPLMTDPLMAFLTSLGTIPAGASQSPNLGSELLSRFIENRQGARREVIPDPPQSLPQYIPPAGTHTVGTHTVDSVSGASSAEDSAPRGRSLPISIISQLANGINEKIKANKTKPPHFNKKTPANYRKIKNYIHNNTQVWLTKEDIDLFVIELEKLNHIHDETVLSDQ